MERLRDYQFSRARDFAKVALGIAVSGRDLMEGAKAFVNDPRVANLMDLAIDPGMAKSARAGMVHKTADPWSTTSISGNEWDSVAAEFASLVNERALDARLPAAHRIPLRVSTLVPTSGASAAWTGEGAAKVVSEMGMDTIVMQPRKVAVTAVLTNDVLQAAPESAQRMVVATLTRAIVYARDSVFISADAEVSGVAPAGILAAAQSVTSTGSSATAIATDLAEMIALPSAAHVAVEGAVWIMSPAAYGYLRLLKVADPDGSVAGFPVLTSDAAAGRAALLATQYIATADDDRVLLRSSGHATLDLAGGNAPTFDLYSKNALGIRVEVYANWATFGPVDSSDDTLAVVSLTNASWA